MIYASLIGMLFGLWGLVATCMGSWTRRSPQYLAISVLLIVFGLMTFTVACCQVIKNSLRDEVNIEDIVVEPQQPKIWREYLHQ